MRIKEDGKYACLSRSKNEFFLKYLLSTNCMLSAAGGAVSSQQEGTYSAVELLRRTMVAKSEEGGGPRKAHHLAELFHLCLRA